MRVSQHEAALADIQLGLQHAGGVPRAECAAAHDADMCLARLGRHEDSLGAFIATRCRSRRLFRLTPVPLTPAWASI